MQFTSLQFILQLGKTSSFEALGEMKDSFVFHML